MTARPSRRRSPPSSTRRRVPPPADTEALLKLIACPDLCSKRWIWEQYDSTSGGQTVKRPGAATPPWCACDGTKQGAGPHHRLHAALLRRRPAKGGTQAVAEAWRNLTAVGARPLAITDNMNFGNPEKPEIMGQFAAAIEGMAEACRALDFPVVCGNVSLYNETEGQRDPADAGDRRPRRARRCGQARRHRV